MPHGPRSILDQMTAVSLLTQNQLDHPTDVSAIHLRKAMEELASMSNDVQGSMKNLAGAILQTAALVLR